MSSGIVYIATGKDYIEEAKLSARNTRRHTDLPITLVTDRTVDSDVFDEVRVDPDPSYSFADKPKNLIRSPYEKTLFLDTDVYLLDPVPELFDLLERTEVATTIDPNEWELRYDEDNAFDDIPQSYPLFQTGVIAYRDTNAVTDLFETWEELHSDADMRSDQSSFRAAAYETKVNHTVLSNLYNCLIGWPMQVTGDVKIIHDSDYVDDLETLDRIGARMNATDNPRLLYTPRGTTHAPPWKYGNRIVYGASRLASSGFDLSRLARRGFRSAKQDGILATARKLLDTYFS